MAPASRLYGLKAIVTNAADGIGEAVARTLAKHGAEVVAADVGHSGVESHFEGVQGVSGMFVDVTDPARQAPMIEAAVEQLGGLDILVTDCPLRPKAPLMAIDDEFRNLVDRRAALLLEASRAALPHLKTSPAGRIINIGFLRSLFSAAGGEAFAAAERNLGDITRALAAETGEFGITANYVQPGAVMTPASRVAFKEDRDLRDFCIRNSAARRLGEPVDVAKVVLFLASDDAVFVSGTGIAVDGGRLDG
jgi:NAD(P)-dependent dehydrogenase (short-subunit alcohol dehydrogenase family)